MILNNRQMKILEILSAEDEPLNIRYLSDEFDVGIRTIQNDLKAVSDFLESNQMPQLDRGKRGYVGLEDIDGTLNKLLKSLYQTEAKDLILTPTERTRVIYLLLLKEANHLTISDLATYLGVSRGTLISDLNQLRQEIEVLPLEIDASKDGLKLTGDECVLREYAIGMYMRNANDSCIYELTDYHRASIWLSHRLPEVRSLDETCEIYMALQEAEKKLGRKFTARSFLFILTWIELTLERIQRNNIASMEEHKLKDLFETIEFKVAGEFAREITKILNLQFPMEEVAQLAIRFLGCDDAMNCPDYAEIFAEFQVEICRLVFHLGNELNVDFSENLSLYNDLVFLMRPLVYRINHGINIINPLLEEIREQYPALFKMVRKHITGVEKLIGVSLPDDELGYIVVHFASIMERRTSLTGLRPNVLLVCDSGVGTSNLLRARITSLYEVNVVAAVTYGQLEATLQTKRVDYILSTMDINHDNVTTFRISPLISEKDKRLLDSRFQPKITRQLDVSTLLRILEKHCIIKDKAGLIKALSAVYRLSPEQQYWKEDDKMLKDVIRKDMIELGYLAKDWENAVRRSGYLLQQGDCIEERYIDSMVSAVKAMGAYIVIGRGIALPHSRSSAGAKKIGISFLRLSEPVEFGHPENDPVDLLFGLSSTDNESHLNVLRDLTRILSNEDKVAQLRTLDSVEEILDLLNNGGA